MHRIGIYNLHMRTLGGGEKRTLAMADHLSRTHEVYLITQAMPDLAFLERYFDVDLSRIHVLLLKEPAQQRLRLPGSAPLQNQQVRYAHFRQIRALKLDVFINNSHGSQLRSPVKNALYMCMFPIAMPLRSGRFQQIPSAVRRVQGSLGNLLLRRELDAFTSYPIVTANSEFTAFWVEKFWGRTAEVVYSVCDPIGPAPDKEKIILNVGRFTAPNASEHHKRQDRLLETFRKMTDLHEAGWRLVFAGSLQQENPYAKAFADELTSAAQGYPVTFLYNAELSQLRDLYRRASLYWHATGYGEAAEFAPHAQEHFGITTVEAMSAGTVPVVINSGGQRETVRHGDNGFLWDDLDSLAALTRQLVTDTPLREQMAQRAIETSRKYSRAAFNSRIDEIVERVMTG